MAVAPITHGHGLRPPTAKERKWDRAHLIVTQSVGLNQEGLDRLNAERAAKKLPMVKASVVKTGSEAVGLTADAISAGQVVAQAAAVPALPGVVDNSTSTAFPPIGNQGSEGACCPFACGYYTMTYMVAKQLGLNAKTGGTSTEFSPKFLYNLVNGGSDSGTWITEVYQIEQLAGAPFWSVWPYTTNDYTAWPTTASVWRSAIPYRMGTAGQVNSIATATGLQQLKTMLADGYVLNVGTDIDGWHFVSGGVGSYSTDSTYAGQAACNFVGGPFDSSGHCLTIVGYDDTMWIDVNGNGKVDPGEIGAFKMANQYGTAGWGTAGFAWISYDALKNTSAVASWSGGNARESAFWYNQAYWINARPAYTPKLLGQITVSTQYRDAIAIEPGISATNANPVDPTTTSQTVFDYANAGNLGFDGTSDSKSATLVIDFTDIAAAGAQNYYADAFSSVPMTISSFQLTDASGNVLGTATNNIPITINGFDDTFPYLTYSLTDTTPPAAITNLSDSADSPTSVTLTWTAPGGDGNSGLAASYRVAYSTSPITASNWSSLTPFTGMTAPQPPGSTETLQLNGLTPGTTYYFAVTTTDNSGNTSALSNILSATTPTALAQTSGTTLTSATAGSTYSTTFSASGGTSAYSWALPYQYTESNPGTGTTLTNGTAQNWESIGGAWNYTFPSGFTFPIGGTSYSSVQVSASGYLDFSHSTADLSASQSDFINNPIIAPYWQYINPTNIYITSSASQVTILWSGDVQYDGTVIDLQATLYANGQILFQYGATATGGEYYGGTELVGVSSGNGTDYTYSNLNEAMNIPAYTQRLFTPASLPPGLTLNPTTGVLSGTPTTSGTYTFPIRVTDAGNPSQTVTQTYTMVIAPNPNPPSITLQPVSQTIDQGQTATFTVASAGGNLSYQWKLNGVNLTNGTTISGATTATLTVTGALAANAGTYTCYVSNSLGNATSNGAVLTVSSGPTISITNPGPLVNAVSLPSLSNSLALTASATSAITNSPTVTWSMVSGPGTVTFTNANAASTSATFSTSGTYVLQATVNDGFLSSSTTLTVGAGVSVSTTGSTVVDQLSFTGALSDGAASTSTLGGTTWTQLCSSQTGLTPSTATALLNLKTSSNTSSGIQFTWTNSFAFGAGSRGDDGTSSSGTATDGLSTYTASGTSATSGVTFTAGSEFFPWSVMEAYNAVHDGTDGYASFKLSSSTPIAYTFWVASSFDYNNPSSTAWPTLINIGGTYSKTSASFTGGTTLTLQGSQSQSSDNTQRYAIGELNTSGGFVSTYNSSTGLYELNVQIGSGTTSTSSGAVLNGIILQATQIYTTHNAPQLSLGSVTNPLPGVPVSLAATASDGGQSTAANLTTTWSMTSGPATATFASASSLNTTVTFPQAGTYVLTLSATDGVAASSQSVTVVVPYTATVTLSNLAYTYDGNAHPATATVYPTGLPVTITYNGSSTAPTSAGSYAVVATVNSSGYTGTTTNTLVISPATATVTLSNLSVFYNGSPQAATATTTPAGLPVTITYNGSATAPTAAGSYTVLATVNSTNYQGSTTGTLVINGTETFTQWTTANGTGAATATPQNDGITNLLKYLVDINPTRPMSTADIAALPTVGKTIISGQPYLTLTYRRNQLETGITVNLQTSPDLVAWTTVTPDLSQSLGTDPVTGDPIVELGAKVTGNSAFIRLNVTSP